MGYIVIPALILVMHAPADKTTLADFGRFTSVINREVSLVDSDGWSHEGIIRAATSSAVTMQLGSTFRTFPSKAIVRAERLRDRSIDGAIKGAIAGLLWGGLASQGADNERQGARIALFVTALCSGLGYAIDYADTNRQTFYQVQPPKPALKVSLRF